MQDHPGTNFSRFYTRIFGVATALILGGACYQLLLPFMGPLLWALSFALVLHPLHVRLTKWLHGKAQYSALFLTVLTLVALVGPLTALGAAFVHQASDLLQYLQTLIGAEAYDNVQLTNRPLLRTAISWLTHNFGVSTPQVRGWLDDAAHASLSVLASMSGRLFLGALGTVVGLCLTIFLMFFFIRDGAAMFGAVRALVPMPATKRQELFDHLAAVTRAVMFGTGLTALVQGTLVGIAFLIVDFPSPLVFGVFAMLLALLPIGGTALLWIPAALILMAQGRWMAAIFMLLWGTLLVSIIDNVLKPLLISGRARVATLTVFIGVLGGVSAYGPIGLFLGPVMLALAIALIEFALESPHKSPHESVTPANIDAKIDAKINNE